MWLIKNAMMWSVDAQVCKYVKFCMLILIKIPSTSFHWYFTVSLSLPHQQLLSSLPSPHPFLLSSLFWSALFFFYSLLACPLPIYSSHLLFPPGHPIFSSRLLIPPCYRACSSHLVIALGHLICSLHLLISSPCVTYLLLPLPLFFSPQLGILLALALSIGKKPL